MSRNITEAVMGAVVLIVAVIFLVFAYSSAQIHQVAGYTVRVKFDRIDGIREGTDVRISGIKVGSVQSAILDPKTFQAVVGLNINTAIKLPTDTAAKISSGSLLGDKFLELDPGGDEKMIPPGGEITTSQSPVSLESIIGQVLYSITGSGGAKGGDTSKADAPAK